MTLAMITDLLPVSFVKNLQKILINGNYGDFVLNPDSVAIIEYFKTNNPRASIDVMTNGSARSKTFWQSLGKLGITVTFGLDGLEDTHHLYRQDTNFAVILDNAKTFIGAGGRAIWKYIVFPHNSHQVSAARELALSLGFTDFYAFQNQRNIGPVYDRTGKKIFAITPGVGSDLPDQVNETVIKNLPAETWLPNNNVEISCHAMNERSLYINAEGKLYPCCWMNVSRTGIDSGTVPRVDEEFDNFFIEDQGTVDPDRLWFRPVVHSWSNKPHAICQGVCGVNYAS